ncbi:MAG: hypothetical protein AAF623_12945, partial [Planctomycetota bacterium]
FFTRMKGSPIIGAGWIVAINIQKNGKLDFPAPEIPFSGQIATLFHIIRISRFPFPNIRMGKISAELGL